MTIELAEGNILEPRETFWLTQLHRVPRARAQLAVMYLHPVSTPGLQHPVRQVTAPAVIKGEVMPGEIADWLLAEYDKLLVAYSSTSPEKVKAVQVRYGANTTSEVLESFFADVAMVPVKGVAQVLCAGGETTSAIVEALNLPEHQIGPEIALGVPALRAKDDLVLSLESGNSGAEHFFGKAHKLLTGKHSGCRADKPGRLHV